MTIQPFWDNSSLFPSFLRNKWGTFITLVILVLFLSLLPQKTFPKVGFTRIDLVVHLVMYGTLAYALSIAMYEKIISKTISLWIYPILLGLFGFVIEILQKILPFNRFFSWEDSASNFLGALSFFLWAYKIRK